MWLFLKEKCAWIGMFVFMQLWMNLIFFLDEGFSNVSILYINVLNILFFLVFISWRYFKELRQLRLFCMGAVVKEDVSPFQQELLYYVSKTVHELEQQINKQKFDALERRDMMK